MANLEFCGTHNMVAYLKKIEGSEGFHQIVDYALTKNPTIYVSLIQQFWQTATTSILDNGEMEITAIIDGKVKIIYEASIRRHFKTYIVPALTQKVFSNMRRASKSYTGVDIPLFPTMLVQGPETEVPQPSSPPHTNVADKAASIGVDVRHGGAATTVSSLDAGKGSGNNDKTPTIPYDSPLLRVKKLEKTVKSSKARRRAKIVVSNDEEDLEDPSKQGGKIDEIDQDPNITLVQHDAEIQGRHGQDMESETEVYTAEHVSTAEPVSTADAAVTTASVTISTASPLRISIADDISAAETLVYIRRIASKDKGKAKMDESESVQTKTKLQQRQERLGYEAALRLQEKQDEEERQRIAKVHKEARSFNVEEWEVIQARVEADEELAHRLHAEEREKYFEAKKAKLLIELINQRKRYFA
ncbi:hypothetical protein Tco_0729084 [Tanacetum coccineum]|uniref:Xylulose kinase-1 n=1 Tax=Tanacetum coccineum TaxID=301880 RepID=A0ABQ4YR17_9ASTR